MILCFLLIHASEYLIISDRSKTPLNSTKKFETARHRFLYDTIIRYVTDYARQNQGLNITDTILKYIKNRMQGVQVSVDEIKLMFVTDIVNKFKIGQFHFCMLDLAKDFDDDLIKHWNVLAQYDLEQIQKSLGKNYSDLKEKDFWINKSVNYIFLAYGTLFYEMLLSQIDNKRWSYVKGNDFDVQINKVTILYAYHFDFIFKKDGCHYEEIDFSIKDIFRIKPTFRAAKAMMSRDHDKPIYIYGIHSFDEMFNAFKRFFYRTNKSTRNTPEKIADIIRNTLKKNENMRRIRSIRTQFFKKEKYKIKMLDRVMDYEPSYFFYFHIQAETDGVFSFDVWKEKAVFYNNVIDLSYFLVYQWLEYRI